MISGGFVLFIRYCMFLSTPPWMEDWSCAIPQSLAAYLLNILKNHTAHACEGDTLTIECPSKTSVSVLSAFYGRRVPNQHLCPAANSNQTAEEDIECASPVAVEVRRAKVKKKTTKWHNLIIVALSQIMPHHPNVFFPLWQKVLSECQDRRSCHIPVFSPVFGQDPCPLTTKYLLVAYKCRPGMLLRLWRLVKIVTAVQK